MNKRTGPFFCIFFLFFLLSGCSSTRVAYNYLDWIITWNLDDYITFSSEQDDWFEQQLEAFLLWHRKDQLPLYIQLVDQLQKDATNQITAEIVKQRFETIQGFWRDIMAQAEPDMSHLLFWLTRDQRQEFFERASKKQKEFEEEILVAAAEKRKQKRLKQTKKMFKRFIGKLNEAQETEIENWVDKLIPSYELWMEHRRNWQAKLKSVLNGKEFEAYKREQLQLLFIEPESLWSAEYRNVNEHNRSTIFSLLVSIHNQLTEKQQQHLQERLESLKEDLVYLSRKD